MAAGSNGSSPLRPRHRRGGGSGFFWFLTGGLLGALGVAVAWMMDERGEPPAGAAGDSPRGAQSQPQIQPPPKPRYDYPTILPDLEVVVPEEDMSNRPPALPPPPEPDPPTAKETPKTAIKPPAKESGKEGPKEAARTPAKEPTKPVTKEAPKGPAKAQAEKPAETATKAGDSETYILQIASLASPAEAEQFKAKLAAQGIAASIQQASVDGKTRYRIRTGPFKGKEAANKVRAQLASRGHQAITIKLK